MSRAAVSAAASWRAAAVLLALLALVLAHGCHGPDVDDELFRAPPAVLAQ